MKIFAPLAFAAVALAQEPDSPELDASAEGLNINLPVNGDVNVVRTQRFSVQEVDTLATSIAQNVTAQLDAAANIAGSSASEAISTSTAGVSDKISSMEAAVGVQA